MALWPADVTAGPVDALMSFFGLIPEARVLLPMPANRMVVPVEREILPPPTDREAKKNWMDFYPQLDAFRAKISIDGTEVDISTESTDGDTVVCPQADQLAEALVKLEVKRKQVRHNCSTLQHRSALFIAES